jgi:hypothetical protein
MPASQFEIATHGRPLCFDRSAQPGKLSSLPIDKRKANSLQSRSEDSKKDGEMVKPKTWATMTPEEQEAWREKEREYFRKYREANWEKILEKQRMWREANRDGVLEHKRKWREANPEKEREHKRKYHEAHPEKIGSSSSTHDDP